MPKCVINNVSDCNNFLFKNTRVYLVTRGKYVEVAYLNKKKALRTAKNYGGDVYEGYVCKYLDKVNFVVNVLSKQFSHSDYVELKKVRITKK